MAAPITWWPALAVALLGAFVGPACGNDDDAPDPTATPAARDDGATTIQQSTVGNVGPYRIGVVSVDAAKSSAVLSIFQSDGSTLPTRTFIVGESLRVAGGIIELLETAEGGSERDTVRVRFVPE